MQLLEDVTTRARPSEPNLYGLSTRPACEKETADCLAGKYRWVLMHECSTAVLAKTRVNYSLSRARSEQSVERAHSLD